MFELVSATFAPSHAQSIYNVYVPGKSNDRFEIVYAPSAPAVAVGVP